MDTDQHQVVKKYADLLMHRNKAVISAVLLAISCGLIIYLNTAKVYQSSSLIMYEEQAIKPSKLTPEVTKKIEAMVNTVSQHVLSRGSLEKIITDFNLYKESREKLPLEDVIALMRDKDIEILSDKMSGDVFKVSFENEDPRKAMLVTNALASRFIEENLRSREERASEATDYVQYELKIAKEAIDKKEAIMRDFKLKYYNEMPEQRIANMSRLNALQEQYQSIQENIQNLEQTRLFARQQYELQKNGVGNNPDQSGNNAELYDLETARQALNNLLARYTAEHPSVRQLQKQIDQLEKEQSGNEGSLAGGKVATGAALQLIAQNSTGPLADKRGVQLRAIELNLESLREQSDMIREQVKKYQQWIENTPVREAQWASITRDYEELKKHYEHLVSQSLAAVSAETLERRQKGSQFRIVDSAYLPVKPLKPHFFRIMLISMALGLGGGLGMILFFDFLDTSFKDVNEVEHFLKLPVLCSVPLLVTAREQKRSKSLGLLSYVFLALVFVGLVSVMIWLWYRGVIVV